MNSLGIDITGKTVVIKASYMKPEFQDVAYRLMLVSGGFGALPDTMGNAVIGTFLHSGLSERVEGFMVEREATDDDLKALGQLYN